MNLRSLLHLETKTVPVLPADNAATDAETTTSDKPTKRFRRKANGALEERLERLLTPSEMDLLHHHRI